MYFHIFISRIFRVDLKVLGYENEFESQSCCSIDHLFRRLGSLVTANHFRLIWLTVLVCKKIKKKKQKKNNWPTSAKRMRGRSHLSDKRKVLEQNICLKIETVLNIQLKHNIIKININF